MLRLNSNNQIVLLYFYDNKKQTTIVSSSCHLKATVNHLRSTSTYMSYFLLLFFVTKYYKSAVYVGGDSVKSDQTFILAGNNAEHNYNFDAKKPFWLMVIRNSLVQKGHIKQRLLAVTKS
jgi:hypothetical protein